MWLGRTGGGGSMVPTDCLMKATSSIQDMYVKKFRTSVHRAFGQNTQGQIPAYACLPASEAA